MQRWLGNNTVDKPWRYGDGIRGRSDGGNEKSACMAAGVPYQVLAAFSRNTMHSLNEHRGGRKGSQLYDHRTRMSLVIGAQNSPPAFARSIAWLRPAVAWLRPGVQGSITETSTGHGTSSARIARDTSILPKSFTEPSAFVE